MRNRLHDGPTHLPTGPRINEHVPPTKRIRASLAALQGAADRAGLSYGIFTQHLTPEKEAQIQQVYGGYREERTKELEQHRKRNE